MPRNTQTVLYDADGNNATKSHLSTNIIILVNGNTVGAVQNLSIEEARGGIRQVDEVGTDGHIDSAPNQSTNYTGSCERVRFDAMRIAEAFSRSFVHVKSQRIPFDIEIQDVFQDVDRENSIITTLKNVWIKNISVKYSSTDFVIVETMGWEAEDINSVIKTSQNVVQGVGNGMANPIILNSIEQSTDRSSDNRGSLDAPGLLNAFLTG
jgi:hypothetical protein